MSLVQLEAAFIRPDVAKVRLEVSLFVLFPCKTQRFFGTPTMYTIFVMACTSFQRLFVLVLIEFDSGSSLTWFDAK